MSFAKNSFASGVLFLLLAGLLVGCQRQQVEKDYARPLPPGTHALRKLTNPADFPSLQQAWSSGDRELVDALERSINWFTKPSTRQFFPLADITHEHAHQSVIAFRNIVETSTSPRDFEQRVYEQFDVYTSVGWDGSGTVLFTGYYSPVFAASRERTNEYRYPLYQRPPDLVSDEATGRVLGRKVGNVTITYPTRAQIEQNNLLAGLELVWLKDKFDSYMIQVNGSAKLIMTDGTSMYIGYAGNNGHEYTSIGKLLIQDSRIDANAGLPGIREYFQQNPAQMDYYMNQNDRFIFFREYSGENWPAGSLGFKVTPWRTLATDKDVFPRASVTLVNTTIPAGQGGGTQPFSQIMVDQDTGGAIRAAGRGDIYMGIGAQAHNLAGRQAAEGRLYYFFLKPRAMKAQPPQPMLQ